MRVLLSAYACEPDRGSEPEVGWQRALHMLPFADEVWVLTRCNNREVIEANPLSHDIGLHFIYYDLPGWLLKLKKQSWFFPFYLLLWQWGAYRLAARIHRDLPFDTVYHVTFASMQSGSLMGRLGIPFIIGPIAGGERSPMRLRRSMPLYGKIIELLRDLRIILQRYNPVSRAAFAAADCIYITTTESLKLIPSKWRAKAEVQLAIGTLGYAKQIDDRQLPEHPKFIYAGNLQYLKGIHFAINALAIAGTSIPNATLTIVGDGAARKWLSIVAKRCGVLDKVEFIGSVPHRRLIGSFSGYTALVFPSLHDSGGMVVLEALSQGLPVICLDLGGPGVMVDDSCGFVVPATGANEAQVVSGIANAMTLIASLTRSEHNRISKMALVRANQLSWSNLTQRVIRS